MKNRDLSLLLLVLSLFITSFWAVKNFSEVKAWWISSNWASNSYLNQTFRDDAPTSGDILRALYGDWITPWATIYTSWWDASCDTGVMNVVYVDSYEMNPIVNPLLKNFVADTVYVLQSWSHLISEVSTGAGTCIAIIGSGNVTIYSTGLLSNISVIDAPFFSRSQFMFDASSRVIIDNIKFDAINDGLGGTHSTGYWGIEINRLEGGTFHDIQVENLTLNSWQWNTLNFAAFRFYDTKNIKIIDTATVTTGIMGWYALGSWENMQIQNFSCQGYSYICMNIDRARNMFISSGLVKGAWGGIAIVNTDLITLSGVNIEWNVSLWSAIGIYFVGSGNKIYNTTVSNIYWFSGLFLGFVNPGINISFGANFEGSDNDINNLKIHDNRVSASLYWPVKSNNITYFNNNSSWSLTSITGTKLLSGWFTIGGSNSHISNSSFYNNGVAIRYYDSNDIAFNNTIHNSLLYNNGVAIASKGDILRNLSDEFNFPIDVALSNTQIFNNKIGMDLIGWTGTSWPTRVFHHSAIYNNGIWLQAGNDFNNTFLIVLHDLEIYNNNTGILFSGSSIWTLQTRYLDDIKFFANTLDFTGDQEPGVSLITGVASFLYPWSGWNIVATGKIMTCDHFTVPVNNLGLKLQWLDYCNTREKIFSWTGTSGMLLWFGEDVMKQVQPVKFLGKNVIYSGSHQTGMFIGDYVFQWTTGFGWFVEPTGEIFPISAGPLYTGYKIKSQWNPLSLNLYSNISTIFSISGDIIGSPVWGILPLILATGVNYTPVHNFKYFDAQYTSGSSVSNFYYIFRLFAPAPENDFFIQITKTADKQYANVGDMITYTITYLNTGSDTYTWVVISDSLPTGLQLQSASPTVDSSTFFTTGAVFTRNIGQVNPGSGDSLVYTALVTQTGIFTNVVVVNWNGCGLPPCSVWTTETTDVGTIWSTKTWPATASSGSVVTYTISYGNSWVSTVTGISIVDDLPLTGFIYGGSSPLMIQNGNQLSLTGQTLTGWTIYTITVTGIVFGNSGEQIVNTVLLSGSICNGFCSNSMGIITISPVPPICGNNIVEGAEQCDWWAWCTSMCTLWWWGWGGWWGSVSTPDDCGWPNRPDGTDMNDFSSSYYDKKCEGTPILPSAPIIEFIDFCAYDDLNYAAIVFPDIPNNIHKNNINLLLDLCIVRGIPELSAYGIIRNTTKAEFVKIVTKLLGAWVFDPTKHIANPFYRDTKDHRSAVYFDEWRKYNLSANLEKWSIKWVEVGPDEHITQWQAKVILKKVNQIIKGGTGVNQMIDELLPVKNSSKFIKRDILATLIVRVFDLTNDNSWFFSYIDETMNGDTKATLRALTIFDEIKSKNLSQAELAKVKSNFTNQPLYWFQKMNINRVLLLEKINSL